VVLSPVFLGWQSWAAARALQRKAMAVRNWWSGRVGWEGAEDKGSQGKGKKF
jgi:hypothetical protein